MKDEIIICECSSAEHQMVLRYDDDKDLGRQVFVKIHLVNKRWHKRLWLGIKYIFGYKCCYGNFEEMILSPKHARQIYNLYRFLRPKLTQEEIANLANCNGQAVEIGVSEKGDNMSRMYEYCSITKCYDCKLRDWCTFPYKDTKVDKK